MKRVCWWCLLEIAFRPHLSPRLVILLSDLFPDSAHVYQLGLDRNPDKDVREFARQNEFLMVTKDADFSELCLLLGFPPKVIWIRLGNCKTADVEALLRKHYADIVSLVADPVIGVLTLL